MITQLRGKISEVNLTSVVLDVNGVGYEIFIPLSSYDRLPKAGSEVTILTHLHHRDDQMVLYGFMTEEERELFKMLIGVSGVGPRVALCILSGMAAEDFKAAVANGDVKMIRSISGIGPKTASRIIVELKDRIGVLPAYEALSKKLEKSPKEKMVVDAVLALISLGYNQTSAHKAVRKVLKEVKEKLNVEELVKRALKYV